MEYEILTPPNDYLPANDYQSRILSPQERLERDSFVSQIEEIIDIALIGNEAKAAFELEALINSAPSHLRAELRQLYNSKLREARRDFDFSAKLSDQQLAILQQLEQAEKTMNPELISKRAIRQMRALFLRNPHLLQVVVNLAKVLLQHGVSGVESINQNQLSNPLNTPNNQQIGLDNTKLR
jgi:hypothetical protein